MSAPAVRIQTVQTPVGPVRAIEVHGLWDPAYSTRFWEEDCDGVWWRPPRVKGLDCDHLTELRPRLRRLSVEAGERMDAPWIWTAGSPTTSWTWRRSPTSGT